jgi:AcrR family transcriptional regulator
MAGTLSRDAVVTTTKELIRTEGLDAVSLRRVGTALGVTAPALYAYVRDKRDLLAAIADEEFNELMARFRKVDDRDPLARTRGYCRAYIDHALENPELFKVMFLFPPSIGLTDLPIDDLASATEAFTLSSRALVEAIEAGTIREKDALVVTLTTWIGMHGAAEVLLMGFDFPDELRDRLIESTIDMVIRGISA